MFKPTPRLVVVQLLKEVKAAVMTILTASATLAVSRQDGTNKSRRRTIPSGWNMTSARMSVNSGVQIAHAMVLLLLIPLLIPLLFSPVRLISLTGLTL